LDASVIENLAALQEIDRRNRERERELSEIDRAAAEQTAALADKKAQLERIRSDSEALGSRRREMETQLQDEERRMKERRMRLGRIRNDKEMASLQREIDLAKEANAKLEEEALGVIEQCELLEGSLREAQTEFAALEERASQHGESGGGRAEQLRGEIASEQAERSRVAGLLSEPVRKKYEQIFEKRGGVAVVEVRQGKCRGCNMNLPPQLFNEIQRRRDVHMCPNCHRILFYRQDGNDPLGANDA
jgi:predicted  nucleic acid-binding Zn-ribbon protein